MEVEPTGEGEAAAAAAALPDDMLLEVFKRLPPTRDVVRCAAVCRRWRRVVSGAGAACLPRPPTHFGFFRNYGTSPLPPFVPTAGISLDLGFLQVLPMCGAVLVDARNWRLLLRELGRPLEKMYVRVPPLFIVGHRVACCVLIPREGVAFRVMVVLFSTDPNHFEVLIYSSVSSAWESATGPVHRNLVPCQGPSVVVSDVMYKLQAEDKYIMVVDVVKMTCRRCPFLMPKRSSTPEELAAVEEEVEPKAACAGGKQTRSAALRSRTEAVAGTRTDVVPPSSVRTGMTTERSCAAITDDEERPTRKGTEAEWAVVFKAHASSAATLAAT
ncbi:hypothetical protein SORBI_3003G170366 [Sorghum bicolor]|uniref:F-box domain-containing protein n=1 Tax=Sorghum bicolor TaxID=4558 RepID=A0A1W0VXQ6_SORBI|nr:hypothetical protein SORBI_3003G170366 [Sorghum bicolor]